MVANIVEARHRRSSRKSVGGMVAVPRWLIAVLIAVFALVAFYTSRYIATYSEQVTEHIIEEQRAHLTRMTESGVHFIEEKRRLLL